jgi:hypothetical protein
MKIFRLASYWFSCFACFLEVSCFPCRFGGPWQLFVDGDGAGHVYCGGFGDGATRPRPGLLLPAVATHLQRLQAQAAATFARAAAVDRSLSSPASAEEKSSKEEEEESKVEPPVAAPDAEDPEAAGPQAEDQCAHADEVEEAVAAAEAEATQDNVLPPEAPSAEARDMAAAVSYLNRIFELSLESDAPSTPPAAEAAAPSGALANGGGGTGAASKAAASEAAPTNEEGREPLASSASVEFLNRLFNQPAAGSSSDSENT